MRKSDIIKNLQKLTSGGEDLNIEVLESTVDFVEKKFVEYLNSHKEKDEGRIIPVTDEHIIHIAIDKLRDQGQDALAETLFYEVNQSFTVERNEITRSFIYKKTGEMVTVSIIDIIRYGNQTVWKDFGLNVEVAKEIKKNI